MASLWRMPVLIQKHRQLTVFEGEKVATVEVGSEGPINTHDTLRMRVSRHRPVISELLVWGILNAKGEQLARTQCCIGGQPEIACQMENSTCFERQLLGITKASLATESF